MLDFFIGRKEEFREIENLFAVKKPTAFLVGVKGRRRSGKTTFVKQLIEKQKQENDIVFAITFSAIDLKSFKNFQNDSIKQKEEKLIEQDYNLNISFDLLVKSCLDFKNAFKALNIFSGDLLQKIEKGSKNKSWFMFFELLNEVVENLKEKDIKCFVFFDEICWFSERNHFIRYFQASWNNKLVFNSNLYVFMAGSNVSWMNNHLFKNKKEFYNRIDLVVDIRPFSVKEIYDFLIKSNPFLSKRDVIFYYLMFGGIVKYYSLLDLNKTFEENFRELLTNKRKIELLKNEKEILFESLFTPKQSKEIQSIIFELTKSKTLSSDNIIKNILLKLKDNQNIETVKSQIYKNLKVLSESEMVLSDNKINSRKPLNFIINDLFSYFFYYWFDEKTQRYKQVQNGLNSHFFDTWKGVALEIFTLNQLDFILHSNGFEQNCLIDKDKHFNFLSKNLDGTSNQIDLLVKNKRQNWFFEIKNYSEEWKLSLQDIETLKKRVFSVDEENIKQNTYFIISLLGSSSSTIKEETGFIKHIKLLDIL